MTMLSVGVIGAGDIARKVHVPVLLNVPGAHVAWLFDADAGRARALGAANGINAVAPCAPADLPACDAALIAIPVGARSEYYDVLAARGTAILAEKPFAVSSAAHRALTERFEPHSLACGFMRRFYASTRLLRRLVRTAPFGRLTGIRISEGARSTASRVDRSYMDDSRQTALGGILSELGCHSLDLALFVTGAREYRIKQCEFVFDGRVDRKVSATIGLSGADALPDCGVELDYCVSWLDPQTNTLEFRFEHCTVWTEVHPAGEVLMGDPRRPAEGIRLVPPAGFARTANQAFYLQWRSFLDGVRTRTESDVSARSSLLGTAMIEELYAAGRRHA